MADLTPTAQEIAARQHGAISLSQLRDAGVGRKTVRRLERAQVLVGDHKSVRRLGSASRTLEQRCAELCLAHPGVFVTGATAGKLLGLRMMPKRSAITLSSRHPIHLEHTGVRIRRSTKVSATDVVTRADGIRIASLPRLAFDLAANLPDEKHRSVVDQLIHEHDVPVADLIAIGSRLYHQTRPGSDRFLSTLRAVSSSPAESDAELRVADALRERGIEVVSNEQWLDLPNGRRARLDLSVPALKWGVEVDVHPSHLGVTGSTKDKQRDRQSRLLGWQIERVTSIDLLDLDAIADELALLYARRRSELAA